METFQETIIIPVEIEMDCFLAQLAGAVDSLLVRINDKLSPDIPIENVEISTVQSVLILERRISICLLNCITSSLGLHE